VLIVNCRQSVALIEMPAAKLLRLPGEWEKYRKPGGDARSRSPDTDVQRIG